MIDEHVRMKRDFIIAEARELNKCLCMNCHTVWETSPAVRIIKKVGCGLGAAGCIVMAGGVASGLAGVLFWYALLVALAIAFEAPRRCPACGSSQTAPTKTPRAQAIITVNATNTAQVEAAKKRAPPAS